MGELKPTVVAHDAGGAKILASLVARESRDCNFVLDGPAIEIFEERLDYSISSITLAEALDVSSEFLTGSGWASNLEHTAICLGKNNGIFTRTFLDHWVNYEARFTRAGVTCMPDELMVGDEHAFELAKSLFPEMPITIVSNPYFLDIHENAKILNPQKSKPGEAIRILYVSEPIDASRGFTEQERVRFFLDLLNHHKDRDFLVTIRPHPAENQRKYEHFERNYSFVLPYSHSDLFTQIASHEIVVGCETMAMAVAVQFGKLVFTALPSFSLPCVIPFPGIRPLPASADGLLKMARLR